uniref:Claudin n=1 Tax=Pygocentrus nattereri TaxID=42514 RepID=A0A3B4D5S1_PYGNA
LSKKLKIGGLALGLIGWILAILTCALPMWVVTSQTYFEGLWMSCVMQTGQFKCNLVQSSGLENVRSIMLVSIGLVLGYIHVVLCIKVKASKANVTIISGVLFIIAGIVLVIPVSLTSYNIIQGSFKQMY